MDEPIAIRLENLSKTFQRGKQRVTAVKGLNLRIPSGQVYGVLGPNGAGKTTTIRMIMDLIRPTGGAAYVYDHNVRAHGAVLRRVGALVEGASFYGYMSGRDNLEVLARTADEYRPARITALLAQVGLAERAGQAVGRYSLGMKQRLGLAAALLGDPDLVILDEPTNGLDPAGIQEMRGFIRKLVDEQGKTVLLSSHQLNEVEQICDRVAIIHKGSLVREGALKDLLADGKSEFRVQAAPLETAAQVLQTRWPVAHEPGWLTVTASPQDGPRIVRELVAHGVDVLQLIIQRQSLEEFFMAATAEEAEHA